MKTAKIVKIVKWLLYMNIIEAKVFIEVCMYYWIWIKNFIIITQLIYVLFKKSKAFIWEDSQIQMIKTLKLILTTASALKIIDYTENMSEVICTINVSREDWKDNLMQVKQEEKKWHVIHYKNKIWSDVKKHYDVRKQEYKNVLKMLKKCCDYFYEIYFVLKLDANILIIQLNQSANDLSEALVTDWIAWIQLFNFTVKHVSENKHTVVNKLSC